MSQRGGKTTKPFKRQTHKMVKHTQIIRRQFEDKLFECVWPFCGIGACWCSNVSRVKYTFVSKSYFLPFCQAELTVKWRYTEHAFIERNQDTERWKRIMFRSSCSQMFFEISVLKNFVILIRKHLCWSLFFKKLQAWRATTLLKRVSDTVASLWILRNFYEHYEQFGYYKNKLFSLPFPYIIFAS